jgi:acyl-CoA synthetase (AMP-forming)/AMP-acid ligase II
VADVAVIGVPHQEMGEEVKALVVPADPSAPPDPAELVAWCRDRLASYKCPRSVDVVDDIGRTTMGKINKRALRAPYWHGARTIGG